MSFPSLFWVVIISQEDIIFLFCRIYLVFCYLMNFLLSLEKKKQFESFSKTKYTLTTWSSNRWINTNPWYLIKETENLDSNRNMHVNVYSSFTHNYSKLGNNQYVFQWTNGKINVVQPYNGILIIIKKEVRCETMKNTWSKLKYRLLSESRQSEKATYHMFPIIMMLWKR